MDTIIRTENLGKRYENATKAALSDINISIQSGALVAITGKSGCGKTTLLNLLGGLDVPTSGKVFVKGTDISSMSENKLSVLRSENIGFVFQFFNLVPEFTSEENILFMSAVTKKKVDKDYLNQLIEILDLKNFIKRIPCELSGGEQQRVAIARALINRPAIVLMDEPTGNLDEANSQKIQKLIQDLKNELKQTIVYVTHDMEMAAAADRVIRLKDGRTTD